MLISNIYYMKRIKKEDERRVRISITISPDLNMLLEQTTNNKSKYIESALIEYFEKKSIYVTY